MAVNCEKVVSDVLAAWTRLNVDEIMTYFAEDALWDNVPMKPAKGQAAIREMTQAFLKDTTTFTAKIHPISVLKRNFVMVRIQYHNLPAIALRTFNVRKH